jgi:hypothetical protein
MYCARATGEHHYFTVPLADIDRIFSRIFRELSSLNRPSRYITMTTSAGKVSILGVTEVGGKKAFALKFNESRNMEWMDRVFLAQYDETTNRVDFLKPFDTPEFFYEQELREIEDKLMEIHKRAGEAVPDAPGAGGAGAGGAGAGGVGAGGAGAVGRGNKPLIALIKPQFEVGKGNVGKGGVVRDAARRQEAVDAVLAFARARGWQVDGVVESPIPGPAGNLELLALLRTPASAP